MDRQQQERFYGENADRLYRFCYRLSGDHAVAEDIASDTFVAFLQASSRIIEPEAQTTYLFRIAVRTWTRHRRRLLLASLLKPKVDRAPSIETSIDLDRAIDHLPPNLKSALVLVKAEGLTYQEASRVLDIPIGTVQSRVRKALSTLRAELEVHLGRADAQET